MTHTNRLTEHLTLKTGKFHFSNRYDEDALWELWMEATILERIVTELPVPPYIFAQIDEELTRRSIMGTAAIEGNLLSEERVGQLLQETSPHPKDRAEREILNLKVAYAYFDPLRPRETPFLITEDFIRDHHAIICHDVLRNAEPGVYRNRPVKVGDKGHGGVYTPPKTLPDVTALMALFVEWLNSPELLAEPALYRAALAHYHLALIHPFDDGNGRIARFLEAAILFHAGHTFVVKPLSNYYYKNIDDYFVAFTDTEKSKAGDMAPFITFYMRGIIASFSEIKNNILRYIRLTIFTDYALHCSKQKTISKRQFSLLQILISVSSVSMEFRIGDLFTHPVLVPLYRSVSESTARRDLKHLVAARFLSESGGVYRLNLRLMG